MVKIALLLLFLVLQKFFGFYVFKTFFNVCMCVYTHTHTYSIIILEHGTLKVITCPSH